MSDLLPGDYVAGLVDGEGCFSLNFRRDVRREREGSPIYYRWKAAFAVTMRKDDSLLLELVKTTLGCGDITYSKGNVRYQVQNTDTLQNIIVPFFKKHRLYGKKSKDFELWSESVDILVRNKRRILKSDSKRINYAHWDEADLIRLQVILKEMRRYKSKRNRHKWI